MATLFRSVDLTDISESGESSEPVLYVGCYVLRWGKDPQPTVGFIPADNVDTALAVANKALKRAYRNFVTLGGYEDRKMPDKLSLLEALAEAINLIEKTEGE